MSKRNAPRRAHRSLPPGPRRHRAWWIAGGAAVLVVAVAAATLVVSGRSAPAPVAVASRADEVAAQRLAGRWVRRDGGYVLEIRSVQADGHLDAAYLNPRPINVSRAEWRRDGAGLRVFIELRDANYPGSTYTLAYVPDGDRLAGAYFQAVQGQTFDVEFVRHR